MMLPRTSCIAATLLLTLFIINGVAFSFQMHINRECSRPLCAVINEQVTLTNATANYQCLKFTGGGIFFWWQAGVAKCLQEHCDLSGVPVVGSSAGALTAAILKTGGNFDRAAEYAIYQTTRERLWESPLGLAFVWGPIVREWLHEILPADSHGCWKEIYLTATPINPWKPPRLLHNFETKSDLIDACMASVHIPFFMDKRPYAKWRQQRFIDGSFWPFVSGGRVHGKIKQLPPGVASEFQVLEFDWQRDQQLVKLQQEVNFLSLITPQGLKQLVAAGYNYAGREIAAGRIPKRFQ